MAVVTNPSELGMAIRAERRRQGLTQGQLAEFCGVGVNFVSEVERGKEAAEIGKVMRLVSGLGMAIGVEKRSVWKRRWESFELLETMSDSSDD